MDNSSNNTNTDTKVNSIEYLDEENPNISEIDINKSENNNIFTENKNKFKTENEKLKVAKIDNSNNNNHSNNEFIIPSDLHKTLIITIILTVVGIILIIAGLIKAIIVQRILGGIMFWILATLVLIPGGFYSYQFIRAKMTKTNYERQEILDSIPRLQ